MPSFEGLICRKENQSDEAFKVFLLIPWYSSFKCYISLPCFHGSSLYKSQTPHYLKGVHEMTLLHYSNLISVQSLSCVRLCDAMDCSMPSFPVHHQLPEPAQTPVHWVGGRWCHPTISSSVVPFSCLQSFPYIYALKRDYTTVVKYVRNSYLCMARLQMLSVFFIRFCLVQIFYSKNILFLYFLF